MHDRGQLGVGVLANAGAIVITMLDRLRRLAFSASALIFLRFGFFGSIRLTSRRSESVKILWLDLPPGLPEMPFLNAIL